MSTTRQGLRDLNAPGRNGRRRDVPALFGVCRNHRYELLVDDAALAWDVCTRPGCGHSRPADAGRGFR